jgi:hypothetical protein
MCSLRNVTASVAEGKERSGDSWFAPGHRNGVAPDDCAGRDGVEVCVGGRVEAVGSHAQGLREQEARHKVSAGPTDGALDGARWTE